MSEYPPLNPQHQKPQVEDNKRTNAFILFIIIISTISGMGIMSELVQGGYTPYMSTETLREYFQNGSYMTNATFQYDGQRAFDFGFNKGIIYSANYTTQTGNLAHIQNNELKINSIQDYCDLNKIGGK